MPPPPRLVSAPLRVTVADVLSGPGTNALLAGKVEAGTVADGDRIVSVPGSHAGSIKKITRDGAPCAVAFAGDHIVLLLHGIHSENLR